MSRRLAAGVGSPRRAPVRRTIALGSAPVRRLAIAALGANLRDVRHYPGSVVA